MAQYSWPGSLGAIECVIRVTSQSGTGKWGGGGGGELRYVLVSLFLSFFRLLFT